MPFGTTGAKWGHQNWQATVVLLEPTSAKVSGSLGSWEPTVSHLEQQELVWCWCWD